MQPLHNFPLMKEILYVMGNNLISSVVFAFFSERDFYCVLAMPLTINNSRSLTDKKQMPCMNLLS